MADDDPVTSGEAAAVQSPDAYLYRTVVNGCRAWIRRKQTGARLARPEATPPARAPELDETRAALDRLSPSQRTAVVLRFYGDLPLAEIAELTGSRLGTVESQLHRAPAQLKDVLAP